MVAMARADSRRGHCWTRATRYRRGDDHQCLHQD